MHHQTPEPAEAARATTGHWRLVRRVALSVLVLALLIVWQTGAFDSALYHVHLNAHDCFYGPKGEVEETECGGRAASECERLARTRAKIAGPGIAEERCISGIVGK